MTSSERVLALVILACTLLLYGLGWYVGRPDRQVDLYPAWQAGRELILRGASPYSAATLRAVQGDDAACESGAGTFYDCPGSKRYWGKFYDVGYVYPVPLFALLLPLCLLPLKLATTVWIVAVQAQGVVGGLLIARGRRRKLTGPLVLALVLLGAFLFEPNFETAFWGQFAGLGLLSAGLCYWALARGKSALAGAALALGIARPQSTPLLIAGVLLWALAGRNWRLLGGFAGVTLPWLALSELLVPGWIPEYWATLQRWQGLTGHLSPLGFALPGPALLAASALLLALFAGVLWLARRAKPGETAFDRAYSLAILVGLLVFPQSSTYAFAPLLVPLLLAWWSEGARFARLAAGFGLFVAPWLVQVARGVFGSAGEADWHLLPLPLFALLVWALTARAEKRSMAVLPPGAA